MKYIQQIGIITGISFVAELFYEILPLPIPASVYGLVMLFLLLLTKIIKLEQVQETADYLLSIMPLFFVPPTVALMTSYDILKGNVISLLILCLVSTVVVTLVTGWIAQAIVRYKKKKHGEDGKKYE